MFEPSCKNVPPVETSLRELATILFLPHPTTAATAYHPPISRWQSRPSESFSTLSITGKETRFPSASSPLRSAIIINRQAYLAITEAAENRVLSSGAKGKSGQRASLASTSQSQNLGRALSALVVKGKSKNFTHHSCFDAALTLPQPVASIGSSLAHRLAEPHGELLCSRSSFTDTLGLRCRGLGSACQCTLELSPSVPRHCALAVLSTEQKTRSWD